MMINPNTAVRTARLAALIALFTLGCAIGTPDPASDLPEIITQLRHVSSSYGVLVKEINPRYIPGDLEGYDEAADRLERLGAQLEQLSRKALRLDTDDQEAVAALSRQIQQLQEAMTDLRADTTPMRAYGYLVRHDIERPRWAFAQVPADQFVEPEARKFNADFTDTVQITAAPGEHAPFQLIAIPIRHDIRRPEVDLPERLEGEKAAIDNPPIRCGQAATRSSPVAEDGREYATCPYRLRDCDPGHTIAADRLQPYWFTLRVPRDAPPGTYNGEIKFSARDVHDVKLTLTLTIPESDPEPTQE